MLTEAQKIAARAKSQAIGVQVSNVGVLGEVNGTSGVAPVSGVNRIANSLKNRNEAAIGISADRWDWLNPYGWQGVDDIPDDFVGVLFTNQGGGQYSADQNGITFGRQSTPQFSLATAGQKPTDIGGIKSQGLGVASSITSATATSYGGTAGAQVPQPKVQGQGGSGIGGKIGAIGQSVAGVAGNILAANSQLAADEYAIDNAEWQSKEKYWLDPNSDVMPDLESYLEQMPSATQALQEGTMTGGNMSEGWQGVVEPTGLVIEKIVTRGGKNSEWKGAGEYASNKAAEGALQGFGSGGWVGAVVGGVVGAIEGVMGWDNALDREKKQKAKAKAEWMRAMKEWTFRRNKAIEDERAEGTANRMEWYRQATAIGQKVKESKKQEKQKKISDNRAKMFDVLSTIGNFKTRRQQQRMQRWS